MGFFPGFSLKIGRFRTVWNSHEIFTNNPPSSWKSTCLIGCSLSKCLLRNCPISGNNKTGSSSAGQSARGLVVPLYPSPRRAKWTWYNMADVEMFRMCVGNGFSSPDGVITGIYCICVEIILVALWWRSFFFLWTPSERYKRKQSSCSPTTCFILCNRCTG